MQTFNNNFYQPNIVLESYKKNNKNKSPPAAAAPVAAAPVAAAPSNSSSSTGTSSSNCTPTLRDGYKCNTGYDNLQCNSETYAKCCNNDGSVCQDQQIDQSG